MSEKILKEEIKLWIDSIEDISLLNLLKSIKDKQSNDVDWWQNLPKKIQQRINKSFEQIDKGRITSNREINEKYGI